ncbi:Uncharacterized conserved protein YraI [Kaistia soli DSM 19436]|uniref:Uncharacterized conserved protein YraI n=2 Tax=Kaistia TaxID=166953 RepID=A0A1M4ZD22_9HYPH|nr:Uncharacterized conserved protein YraI [Kaistia soli DSM 19436]
MTMRIPSESTRWRHRLVAVAALGFSLIAGSALADDAFTTGSVNMRTGPGTGYAKIGTLPRGTGVDVLGCTSGWCQVSAGGAPGWVSDNYLAGFVGPPPVYRGPPPPPVYVTPPPVYVEPPPYYGPGYYGPGYRPPPPYYDRPGYRPPPPYYGDRPPGYRPPPGGWNNNDRPPPGYRPPPGQGGGGQGGGWQGGNRPPPQGEGRPPQAYQPPQQGGQRPPPQQQPQQGGQRPPQQPQGGQAQQPPQQQGQPGKPQFFVPGTGAAPPCQPGTMFCSNQ